MRLTNLGKVFVERSNPVISTYDGALDAIRQAAKDKRDEFRLAVAPGVSDLLLPLLTVLLARAPRLRPYLTAVRTGQSLREQLVTGKAHAALTYLTMPSAVLEHDIETLVLDRSQVIALLPQWHMLARVRSAALSALSNHPLVLPGDWPQQIHQRFIGEFVKRGLQPQLGLTAPSQEFAIALVQSGQGYMFAVRRSGRTPEHLKVVSITDPLEPIEVALMWSRDQAARVKPLLAAAEHVASQSIS
jgi:DNA-binding transcriptional LysR family regulator